MIGPVARCRRTLYGVGVLRSSSLPRPVVSVGNLTAGGSGKTPHVQFLAGWLSDNGVRVAILSRGYGRKTRGVLWASRGQGAGTAGARGDAEADRVGDEPAFLASTLPGVPVLVGESRFAAGTECLRTLEVDAFLLDDGYQHLSLRRDMDILLVDAVRGLGNRRTLPFGPLREPADHARFADALVVTRCENLEHGRATVTAVPFPPGRPVAFTRICPFGLVDRSGKETPLPPGGKEVVAFSGIAQNDQFENALRASGFVVRRFLGFRDHHPYRSDDLERIRALADGLPVVTTEKDMVRLPDDVPFPLAALRVKVEFLSGWENLSRLVLERIGRREGR
ncbi:MAG: tetraacyldisaccharide 4'-kinase [Candidatus Deferrimicrobiaceae bacterium]